MIFNFFKSRPTLKEIIPDGFVDIHSHILPGIDDGAKNVEESMELISEMKKLGFSKIIGTPHTYPGIYENSNNSIKTSFEKITKKINLEIKLDYASEYMIDESLINKADQKSLLCLKENFVLIETSFIQKPLNLSKILFHLQTNGYVPIIAHPERYAYFDKKSEYKSLVDRGCKLQLNLLSAIGYYGKDALQRTDYLLENNMFEFVGSDLHKVHQINLFKERLKIKNTDKLIKIMENNNKFY